MTADEVIAALRDALEGAKDALWLLAVADTAVQKDAAAKHDKCRAALDLARQYRGWRSLEEEKPVDGQRVLVLDRAGRYNLSRYREKYGGIIDLEGRTDGFANALWHPLPEPPKP